MQVAPSRSYRCLYAPVSRGGFPALSDTGVLPFVQVRAASAEDAQRAAHAVTGAPIVDVQRIEAAA